MGAAKEPIRLRKRTTPTGNVSLYLDIYLNGKRSYEYLKMYLVPEKTKADKEKNRQTLQLAEAVKAKRIVELQNGEFGFNAAYKRNQFSRLLPGNVRKTTREHRQQRELGKLA